MKFDPEMQTIDGTDFQKIALVSDTHGPVHHAIVAKLNDYDCVVHAGDLGAWNNVATLAAPFFAVSGNNDIAEKWPTEEQQYLKRLPEVLKLLLDGGELIVIHGHQFPVLKTRHLKLRETFPAARIIVYGHSHRALSDKTDKPWVINPGAAGYKRNNGGASFICLTVNSGRWRIRPVVISG